MDQEIQKKKGEGGWGQLEPSNYGDKWRRPRAGDIRLADIIGGNGMVGGLVAMIGNIDCVFGSVDR